MRSFRARRFIPAWAAFAALGAGLFGQVQTTPQGAAPVRGGFTPDNRVLNLHGRVTLQDGSPPPGDVSIERVCGTYTIKEGVTNGNGEFSVQLGQNQAVVMDASDNGATRNTTSAAGGGLTSGVSPNAMWDCELRATLVGYRSNALMLSQQRNLDPSNLIIILHKVGEVPGSVTSATSALAPRGAKKAVEKGIEALQRNKPGDAEKEFAKAVKEYDRYAEAWYGLGRAHEIRRQFGEARAAYAKAIAADGNYVNPHDRLYRMAIQEKNWQEAADVSAHVLALNPYEFPDAFYANAVANLELGNLEAAARSAREATTVAGPKADPRAHYVLGMALGRQGEFAGAARSLRTFLELVPDYGNRQQVEALIATADRESGTAR